VGTTSTLEMLDISLCGIVRFESNTLLNLQQLTISDNLLKNITDCKMPNVKIIEAKNNSFTDIS